MKQLKDDGYRRSGDAKRKIIQIAAASGDEQRSVYALCDDGKVFNYDWDSSTWFELAPISRFKPLVSKRYRVGDEAIELLEYEREE